MVLGGNASKVLMIEMDGKEIGTEMLLEAIRVGLEEIGVITRAVTKLSEGVPKLELAAIVSSVTGNFEGCAEKLIEIFSDDAHDKISRDRAIHAVREAWVAKNSDCPPGQFTEFVRRTLKKWTMGEGRRCDGRLLDEVRPIQIGRTSSSRRPSHLHEVRPIQIGVDVYSRLHGSALFQRGQTQVFSTVTFDSAQAAFHPDAIAQLLGTQQKKTFMLHYEFPQFAVSTDLSSHGPTFNFLSVFGERARWRWRKQTGNRPCNAGREGAEARYS